MSQAAADREDGAKAAEESLRRLAAAMPQGVALFREGRVVWGNDVFLNAGPALGTIVATDGVAEIYGAEYGM